MAYGDNSKCSVFENMMIFTDLFLAGGELGDVGVVALLDVLVGALQDGLLLQAGHCLLLLHAAQPGVGVLLAAAEVNAALQFSKLSSRSMPSGSIFILIKQGAVRGGFKGSQIKGMIKMNYYQYFDRL